MIYPIPPRNSKGKDNCAFWDGFLTEEDINAILAYPEWVTLSEGLVKGDEGKGSVDYSIRNSKVSWIEPNEKNKKIWEILSTIIAEVNSSFFHFDLTGMYEPIQLSLYSATETHQGHYDWHTDMTLTDRSIPRKLSMSLLLSDPSEFEGGELQIKATNDEEMILESKKGRAWFFPSWVLHRVTPVTKGVRRSLVVWVGGPSFK